MIGMWVLWPDSNVHTISEMLISSVDFVVINMVSLWCTRSHQIGKNHIIKPKYSTLRAHIIYFGWGCVVCVVTLLHLIFLLSLILFIFIFWFPLVAFLSVHIYTYIYICAVPCLVHLSWYAFNTRLCHRATEQPTTKHMNTYFAHSIFDVRRASSLAANRFSFLVLFEKWIRNFT